MATVPVLQLSVMLSVFLMFMEEGCCSTAVVYLILLRRNANTFIHKKWFCFVFRIFLIYFILLRRSPRLHLISPDSIARVTTSVLHSGPFSCSPMVTIPRPAVRTGPPGKPSEGPASHSRSTEHSSQKLCAGHAGGAWVTVLLLLPPVWEPGTSLSHGSLCSFWLLPFILFYFLAASLSWKCRPQVV